MLYLDETVNRSAAGYSARSPLSFPTRVPGLGRATPLSLLTPTSHLNMSSQPTGPRKPFGELTPWAEPAWYRVSWIVDASGSSAHSSRRARQGLPSPYYSASHENLRVAIREWSDEYTFDVGNRWEEVRTCVWAEAPHR